MVGGEWDIKRGRDGCGDVYGYVLYTRCQSHIPGKASMKQSWLSTKEGSTNIIQEECIPIVQDSRRKKDS